MKLLKKFFILVLLSVVAFALVGCDDEVDYEKQIEDLTDQIEALQESLANLNDLFDGSNDALEAARNTISEIETTLGLANGLISSTQADLDKAEEALEEAKKKIDELANKSLEEIVYDYFIKNGKLDTSEFTWTNMDDIFEVFDTVEDSYYVDAGTKVVPEFLVKATGEYRTGGSWNEDETVYTGGITLNYNYELDDYDYVGFDYFWADTADYNGGVKFDEKTGELEFALPGQYGVLFYAKDNPVGGYAYPAYYAANGMGNADTQVFFEITILPGAQLVVPEDKSTELKVGETVQLSINDAERFEVVSYASSDEAVATVSATGLVTAVAAGKTTIFATVKDEDDNEREISIPVEVVALPEGELAGGTDGALINLKGSSAEQKSKILAYMERYLINRGASIPIINNSGLVIYSDRVNFIADTYVPQMGYGPTVLPFKGGGVAEGTEADPAYRMWTSADPSTLNHLAYADSIESDFMSLTNGSLFSFDWKLDENGKGIGWEVKAEMAKRLAYPVELKDGEWTEIEDWNNLTNAKSWKFDLRDDLKFSNGDAMNADDFIYTYQEALDGNLAYRRANLWYGSSLPIAGAKEYYDAKGELDWDTVGIKKVNNYSFVITFKDDAIQWDVIYNYSGFMFTPIHRPTYEANKATYGTSLDKYVGTGPYKISYWEKGKEYRFVKNENYFLWDSPTDPDDPDYCDVRKPALLSYSYTIVKDNNAALALFKENKLDVTSIPASAYDDYKTDTRVKTVPGATSFRLSTNRLTQAELDAKFGVGAWNAKPIMQEDDFMWALYYGVDRTGVQAITKTSTGWSSYFTDVYAIVSSTEEGVEMLAYRQSEWGRKVFEGIEDTDYDLSYDSLGYNAELATTFFVSAVQSMIDKGVVEAPTEEKPLKITIEIAHFDGVTQEATYAYVCQVYNDLFNNTAKFGDTVVFEAVSAPQPGMDVYYVKQMTGQFDLALAGISGGTLDPAGFMETFCDDNRSGLLLSLGCDTHNPNILIDLDLDNDGTLDGAKWWSFDALYSAYYGETFIKNGMEAEKPAAAE